MPHETLTQISARIVRWEDSVQKLGRLYTKLRGQNLKVSRFRLATDILQDNLEHALERTIGGIPTTTYVSQLAMIFGMICRKSLPELVFPTKALVDGFRKEGDDGLKMLSPS